MAISIPLTNSVSPWYCCPLFFLSLTLIFLLLFLFLVFWFSSVLLLSSIADSICLVMAEESSNCCALIRCSKRTLSSLNSWILFQKSFVIHSLFCFVLFFFASVCFFNSLRLKKKMMMMMMMMSPNFPSRSNHQKTLSSLSFAPPFPSPFPRQP